MSDVSVVCVCACGRSYTKDEWDRLPLVGWQLDEEETLELRNYECGSTRAIVLDKRKDT